MAQHSSCDCNLLPCRCAHLWMDQSGFLPAQHDQPVYVDFTNPFYYLPEQSYCWQLPAYSLQATAATVTPPNSPYPTAGYSNCAAPQQLPPLQQYPVLSAAQQPQQSFAVPNLQLSSSQAVWTEEGNKENELPSHLSWNEGNEKNVRTNVSNNLARPANSLLLPSSRIETTPYSRNETSHAERKKRQSPLSKDVIKKCSNCGVTESSLWRRTGEGHVECNPCQLHFRRYGVKRPLEMRTEKIHRRNRKPREYQRTNHSINL